MPAWACIGGIACLDVYNAFTRRVRPLSFAAFKRSCIHPMLLLNLPRTVLEFGFGRARRRLDGWRPLLDFADTT